MRRFLFVLLLIAGNAWADSFSFQLNEVRFPDFVRLVYSDVLQRSYVLDTDTIKNQDAITVHVRNKSPAEVEGYLLTLLEARGFEVVNRFGVDVIGKKLEKEPAEKDVFVYRPRFRSVSYLLDIVSGFFPKGAFAGQRQVTAVLTPVAGAVPGQVGTPVQGMNQQNVSAAPVDSGNSAYSQIDKHQADTLVFQGVSKDVDKLSRLLSQLDVASGELLVKAVVYEVRTRQSEGSAVTLAASILAGKFGISIDGGASAANAVKIKFNNFDAMYSALSDDSRFKLLSSPNVRVRSGTSARFVAGSEVPVLGNISYQQNGTAVQSVEYKSSGVILDLKPEVREDTTDLTIFQQISSFVATSTGVNQSPTLLKRELKTQVSARADEMIILGGLEENQDTQDESGLSFLPKFFRASGGVQQKTEIMVVLHVQRI